MTVPDEQLSVFLREIKDRPDDDVPRLILADWLQDHGDPRGEFVHLQVRRARLSPDDAGAMEMHCRERQLLRRHAFDWLGPLVDFASAWEFSRGFMQLVVRWDGSERRPARELACLAGCEAIRWVESVRLRSHGVPNLSLLFLSGLLGEVSCLDLSDVPLVTLGSLMHDAAGTLRTLFLRRTRLNDGEIERLATARPLAGLRWLDLSDNGLGDADAVLLAGSPTLRDLARLDVTNNRFTAVGREALASAFGDRVRLR